MLLLERGRCWVLVFMKVRPGLGSWLMFKLSGQVPARASWNRNRNACMTTLQGGADSAFLICETHGSQFVFAHCPSDNRIRPLLTALHCYKRRSGRRTCLSFREGLLIPKRLSCSLPPRFSSRTSGKLHHSRSHLSDRTRGWEP